MNCTVTLVMFNTKLNQSTIHDVKEIYKAWKFWKEINNSYL